MQDITIAKQRLATLLYERSYKEGHFTLASGRTSDYYFDCRVTALSSEGSCLLGQLFTDCLRDRAVVGVGGMTLGADPLVSATTVCSYLANRPLNGLIVRKEAKDHGTGQYVEGMGNFAKGDRIAVLEDVITTGGSVLKACQRLEEQGLCIDCICVVLDREEGGRERLEKAGYTVFSLFTKEKLLALAKA
ncbi:MAG: orotate phosphoribosyltransferase [Desulfovibrio sp.]|nr:orotate phosphoribosyltransferase [Desulfovibrio sp.]